MNYILKINNVHVLTLFEGHIGPVYWIASVHGQYRLALMCSVTVTNLTYLYSSSWSAKSTFSAKHWCYIHWVFIRWESPTEVNFPISHYDIVGASAAGDNVQLSTLDNNTFINVTGLDPGTTYNFSVVAVIQAGEVVTRSEESAPLKDIGTGMMIFYFQNLEIFS